MGFSFRKTLNLGGLIFILFLTFFILNFISFAYANEYKIPKFNWVLTDTASNGIENIAVYVDSQNVEKVDGYILFWQKFENNTGKTIVRYAINCKKGVNLLLGGLQYDLEGNLTNNYEKYTKQNFKKADNWTLIDLNTQKTESAVCKAFN